MSNDERRRVLLVDNYDSFVHNLARYVRELGCEAEVLRNDAVALSDIATDPPQAIILSPGPCTPDEAGMTMPIVRQLHERIPMLGVCLGHQAIAQALGGETVRATQPMHGKTSTITHDGEDIFAGLPTPLTVCRYHSLVIEEASLPDSLRITAWDPFGVPMAIAHRTAPLFGVQFHPEAVLTQGGYRLLANFLRIAGLPIDEVPSDEHPLCESQPVDLGHASPDESEFSPPPLPRSSNLPS